MVQCVISKDTCGEENLCFWAISEPMPVSITHITMPCGTRGSLGIEARLILMFGQMLNHELADPIGQIIHTGLKHRVRIRLLLIWLKLRGLRLILSSCLLVLSICESFLSCLCLTLAGGLIAFVIF